MNNLDRFEGYAAHLHALDAEPASPNKIEAALLKCAADIRLEPVRWLWKGFVPSGMLTLVGGAPGCGKTTLSLSLAAIATREDSRWPDKSLNRKAGNVVVWSGEDHESVILARLMACGADLARAHVVTGTSNFNPAHDWPLLAAEMVKLKPVLLVIDPVISAVTGNGNASVDVRKGLQPVVDLAATLGCAVIGITHFSKGGQGRDPTERITGSVAFAALARVVLVAAKGPPSLEGEKASPRVMMLSKSNIGPDEGGFQYDLERIALEGGAEGQAVIWGEPIAGNARDVLAESEAVDAPGTEDESDEVAFIRELLSAGAMTVAEIERQSKAAGFSFRKIQKLRKVSGAKTKKSGMSGGWVWFMGEEDATEETERPEEAEINNQGIFGTFGAELVSSGDQEAI